MVNIMSNFGVNLQKSAYGELLTAHITPIIQVNAVYGILDDMVPLTVSGGTTTSASQLFIVGTGVSPSGISLLTSREQITTREGQGIIARFSALFSPGVANNAQVAGLIGAEDRLGFGYNGVDFGINFSNRGIVEQQDLQITTPAVGAENATVTVNGFAYTVPLTAGTVDHNAYEIAASMTTQDPLHHFESVGDTVRVISLIAAPESTYAFSSASAVGAWTQNMAGALVTSIWIPKASWNLDPDVVIDPSKGNLYEISYQYPGFGSVVFSVMNGEINEYTPVHQIRYPDTSTETVVTSPNFNLGYLTFNFGNTTNIEVKSAAASAFIAGDSRHVKSPQGVSAIAAGIGATETSILTIRNPSIFKSRLNKVPTEPLMISIATDSTKSAIFTVRLEPTFTGSLVFSDISTSAMMQVATDNLPVTGGEELMSFVVTKESALTFDISNIIDIEPGETIVVSSRVTSGAASSMQANLTWNNNF